MNSKTIKRVMADARRDMPGHERLELAEEHGGVYVQCLACGAMWSVHFTGAGHTLFDAVGQGDDTCIKPVE